MSDEGDGRKAAETPPSPIATGPTSTPETVAHVVEPGVETPRPMSMRTAMMAMEVRASRGFMTDPQSLAEYDRSCPGLGKEIWGAFRHDTLADAEHRRAMERESMEKNFLLEQRRMDQGDRAQRSAALCFLVGAGLAALALYLGHPVVAATMITSVLAAIAGSFIVGRRAQAREAVAQIEAEATPPRPRERPAPAPQAPTTTALARDSGSGNGSPRQ